MHPSDMLKNYEATFLTTDGGMCMVHAEGLMAAIITVSKEWWGQYGSKEDLMDLLFTLYQRVWTSVTTFPSAYEWMQVICITAITTALAGLVAVATGFIRPIHDFKPPCSIWKPLSAFFFPALFEELIWRAAFLPTPIVRPPMTISSILTTHHPSFLYPFQTAAAILVLHLLLHHPVFMFSQILYPKGTKVFSDPTFLCLAGIVLGGTTLSYLVSGGSVWAAVLTHGVAVALWRDYFGGEQALMGKTNTEKRSITATTTYSTGFAAANRSEKQAIRATATATSLFFTKTKKNNGHHDGVPALQPELTLSRRTLASTA